MIRTTSLVLALVLGGCFKKPPETPVEAGQTTVEVVDADQAPAQDIFKCCHHALIQ